MKLGKALALIISLTAINQVLAFTPSIPQEFYFGITAVALLLVFLQARRIKFNWIILWFILAAGFSLIVNEIPGFFNAPLRLIGFVVVSGLIGPLMKSKPSFVFKGQLLRNINRLVLFFSAISLFFFLAGISFSGSAPGPPSGVYNHSMMLGPLAGISMIIAVFLRLRPESIKSSYLRNRKWLVNLLVVIFFLAMLLASSRAAIAGTLAGLMFFLYKVFQKRLTRLMSVVFSLVLILIISFPLWSDFTTGIQEKITAAEVAGDITHSRKAYWNARAGEFLSSPVFGIGFATVALKGASGIGVNTNTGVVEPGTSWLSILSMVGILGFIPILFLFWKSTVFLLKESQNRYESGALGGILFFFITHMFAEGYFLAAGSFLFFYIWLLLGVLEKYKTDLQIRII